MMTKKLLNTITISSLGHNESIRINKSTYIVTW